MTAPFFACFSSKLQKVKLDSALKLDNGLEKVYSISGKLRKEGFCYAENQGFV